MSSRDRILAKVRAALIDVPAAETPADVPVPRDYRRSLDGVDLVEVLVDRLLDYKAIVHRDVQVADLLVARGRIAVPPGIPSEWIKGVDTVGEPLSTSVLDTVDAVITGCAVAIAETGTIVLDASPAQGRRALTLVPDHHVCVVGTDQIVGTVPEALERLDPSKPLTWISGPSATSDIELDRVEGVHGPRTLEVVII